MKVGIFLNTTSGPDKQEYLYKFARGVARLGDEVVLAKKSKYVDCDLALIFGFYNKNISGQSTHLYRKKIFEEHTKRGKKCLFIDADLFRFAGKIVAKKASDPTHHVRIAYGSIYPDEANYFNKNSPPDRWNIIRRRKKIELLNWRSSGKHILICANSDPDYGRGWATKGVGMSKWLRKTVKEIRKISDRPIIVRYHPNGKPHVKKTRDWKALAEFENIKFSGGITLDNKYSKFVIKNTSMIDDCKNAHACVVYNSSASVICILNGVPVFTSRKDCPAYPVANKDIRNLENPILYDRSQWLHDLSYSVWTKKEMEQGIPWRRIKNGLISKR